MTESTIGTLPTVTISVEETTWRLTLCTVHTRSCVDMFEATFVSPPTIALLEISAFLTNVRLSSRVGIPRMSEFTLRTKRTSSLFPITTNSVGFPG